MSPERARSYLFVPGNRPDQFPKAVASGADQIILDLEDAVPSTEKDYARAEVRQWLAAGNVAMVRVNNSGTRWFAEDFEICKEKGVAGVVLPKVESGHSVRHVASAGIQVLPLIETALGFWNLHAIATEPGVSRLVFGSLDLRAELRLEGDNEELLYFRSQLILISRVAGLAAPVDGVTAAVQDLDQVRVAADRARRLGFGAKLCIHPRQVPVVHACFAPTEEQKAWARRIRAATQATGSGPAMVDGQMIDKPIIEMAEEILARSREPVG